MVVITSEKNTNNIEDWLYRLKQISLRDQVRYD